MMNPPRLLVTRRWPEPVEVQLCELYDVTLNSSDKPLSPNEMRSAVSEFDVILPTVTDTLNADVIDVENARTKIMCNFGVGFSHIDTEVAKEKGITVTNTPDVLSECTADIAMTLMLMTARRFGADSLSDLRAIPWVFAWTQNRHMISSWYGFGTAIETLRETHGKNGEQMLGDMFDQSRLFRLIVDEVEKSLYHTDPKIARNYASLVENDAARDAFWGEFSAEYERSCNAVFWLTGQSGLAIRFPAFRGSFLRNAPLLARTHELQVHLLHELRSQPNKAVSAVPLLQTMNCISTGLGWTG